VEGGEGESLVSLLRLLPVFLVRPFLFPRFPRGLVVRIFFFRPRSPTGENGVVTFFICESRVGSLPKERAPMPIVGVTANESVISALLLHVSNIFGEIGEFGIGESGEDEEEDEGLVDKLSLSDGEDGEKVGKFKGVVGNNGSIEPKFVEEKNPLARGSRGREVRLSVCNKDSIKEKECKYSFLFKCGSEYSSPIF